MRYGLVLWAVLGSLAACSAVDVGPELKLMSDATTGTSEAALALANADPADERLRRLQLAAAAPREPWAFTGNCQPLPQAGQTGGPCELDRRAAWDTPLPEDALRRKISAINAYVAALADIAQAQNDATLGAAYTGAVTALGGLADAAENEALQRTINRLKEDQTATSNLATFLVANRRAQILKRTVLRNRQPFAEVVNEVINLVAPISGEAERLNSLHAEMFRVRTAAILARRGSEAEYRDALDQLDRAHTAFLDARKASLVGQISALAEAHEALAQRLRRPASLVEIETFTKALAALKVDF